MKRHLWTMGLLTGVLAIGSSASTPGDARADGACCKPNGTCVIESSTECATDEGTYIGESSTCDPGSWPCDPAWSHPTMGPKLALIGPRPFHVMTENNMFDTGEADSVAHTFDLIQAYLPSEVAGVRAVNPGIISLYSMTWWGVPWNFDYDEDPDDWNNNPDAWWVPDTLWSPVRLVQHAYWKNYYEDEVDFAYKKANGDYIEHWLNRACNWTSYCPVGVWGWTEGLTWPEICLEAFLRVLDRDEFRDYWDGLHFDTAPPACCFSEDYIGLEYDEVQNDPGTDDYCFGESCFYEPRPPFVEEERATSEWFFSNLLAYTKPRHIPVLIGQDGIKTDSREDFSGWKIERWMTQPIPNPPTWEEWWDGDRINVPGYYESEEDLAPLADSLGGWDWTLFDVEVWEGASQAHNDKLARYGLGTASLGDGYFGVIVDGLSTNDGASDYYIIDEMKANVGWQWQLPAETDAYEVPGLNQWRREFLRPNGDPCILVVDLDDEDAYLYGHGACCTGDDCELAYEVDCDNDGGVYLGDDMACPPYNPIVSGGGNIRNTFGSGMTANPGQSVAMGRKTGLSGWEDRGFLKFHTSGIVPAAATVDSVKLLLDVGSITPTHPDTWKLNFYVGDFIDGSIDTQDWSAGTLCANVNWGSNTPTDAEIDLGSQGISAVEASADTDIRLADVSTTQAFFAEWELWLGPKSKLAVYMSCGGGALRPVIVEQEANSTAATALSLSSFPQPGGSEIQLKLVVPSQSSVTLEIFDVSGRRVETVFSGDLAPGAHVFPWSAKDRGGAVYFARARSASESTETRIVTMR